MGAAVAANVVVAYRFRPLFRPASQEQVNLDRYREVVDPLRALAADRGRRRARPVRRRLRLRPVAAVPAVAAPLAVRHQGPVLPQGRRVLRLRPAVAALPGRLRPGADRACLLAAAVVHYLFGGIRLQAKQDRLSGAAQVQISVLAGLFVLFKARGLLAGPLQPDHRQRRPVHRHGLHRQERRAAVQDDPDLHRDHLRGAVLRQRVPPHLDAAVGRPRAAGALLDPARRDLARHRAAVPGQALRAGQGGAVHRAEHQGHPRRLRHRRHEGHASTTPTVAEPRRSCSRTPSRSRASGCSTRRWSPRRSSSSSRCAATTAWRRSLDVDRYQVDGADRATWWSRPASSTRPACPTASATGPTSTPSTPTATASIAAYGNQRDRNDNPVDEQRRQAGLGRAGPAAHGRPDRHVHRRLPAADLLR